MNNFTTTAMIRRAVNWLNLLLLAATLGPLLGLAYYNHPSAADDFGYIDTVQRFGWLEAMHHYYTGWTGRYFGILLNHSNPLLFHSFAGFKVAAALLILAAAAAIYGLVRQLTPTFSRVAHLGFTGVFFFLFLWKIPNLPSFFYWMASFVSYTVPSILTIGWLIVVLRWCRLKDSRLKALTCLFAGFLVFAIIGFSEPNLLTILILIAGLWAQRLVMHRNVDALMLSVAAAAVLGCVLYFTAPGLDVRLGGNPLGGNIPASILNAFKMLGRLTIQWATPLLLIFTILWWMALSRLTPAGRVAFTLPLWIAFLWYVGLLSSQLFTSYYGIGIDPTDRELDLIYFTFLIGWFYVAGVIFYYVGSRLSLPAVLWPAQGRIAVMAVLIVLISFKKNENFRMMYGDLLSGKAAAYDAELYRRYALIESSTEPVVYVPAIQHQPRSLYIDDIRSDPTHWWNKLMASYFGKKALHLTEKPPLPPQKHDAL